MKKSMKPKIIFVLSVIFFLTSIVTKINNIYKIYKDKNIEIRINDNISKDEEEKILELINTMDEAVDYLQNDKVSYEVKKQLINDIIDSVNVINTKLDIYDYRFIDELNKQYYNLNEKKYITFNILMQLYKEWKEEIL